MTHLDPVTGAAAGTTTTPVAPGTPVEAPAMASGEISPKAILATLLPFVAGVVLVVLDKVVLGDDVPDEAWLALFGAGPLAGLGGFIGRPGLVVAGKPAR